MRRKAIRSLVFYTTSIASDTSQSFATFSKLLLSWLELYLAGTFTSSVFLNEARNIDDAAIVLLLLGAIANI